MLLRFANNRLEAVGRAIFFVGEPEAADQTQWSQRAISSCTGCHRQGHILVSSVKDRPQDVKGDMILGCHLADTIRFHIDRQRS